MSSSMGAGRGHIYSYFHPFYQTRLTTPQDRRTVLEVALPPSLQLNDDLSVKPVPCWQRIELIFFQVFFISPSSV